MTKLHLLTMTAALAACLPVAVHADSRQPVLVHEAQYGTVHEVLGAELPVAAPRANCPAKFQPIAGGPCFDKVALDKGGETRVLGVSAPLRGNWLSGVYGRDFQIYGLFPAVEGLQARVFELPTSDVAVPRDCYALAGEEVAYSIAHTPSGDFATESQVVACGGGPRSPNGPYTPEGPPLTPGSQGVWHNTEMLRAEGGIRYLATPGTNCDPQYSLKSTYCAQPAVSYLQANPGVKELDLIAARHAVRAGDILATSEVDQWVLKRKGDKKFKADSRWSDQTYLSSINGCTPVESVGWWVTGRADGLYIMEKAMNRCGAPMAPVPTEIWEAYGDELYIVDCGERRDWRKGRPRPNDAKGKSPGDQASECFDGVGDYLRRNGRSTTTVVVLNERARVDDHLYSGGYISYDVAEVSINPDKTLSARRLDYYDPSGVYMSNCTQVSDGPAESKGFVIVRSMGISWAKAYRWMSCPVY